MQRCLLILLLTFLATGCVPTYSLVAPGTLAVADGNLNVRTTQHWNKVPKSSRNIKQEEMWTRNGPMLDLVSFIAGIEDGKPIARQRDKDDRQVPVFKANMTPPELMAMIESYYRIRAGTSVFETTNVQPVTFLNQPGMQVDYEYVAGDDVERQGRALLAVVDGKFYMMALDGTALHYFGDSLEEFESMARDARR